MHTSSLSNGFNKLRVTGLHHFELALRVSNAKHAVYIRVRTLTKLNQVLNQRRVSLQVDRLECIFKALSLELDGLSVSDDRYSHLLLAVVEVPLTFNKDHVRNVAQ